MRFDLGSAYIGKANRNGKSKFFSVEDLDGELYVYQFACVKKNHSNGRSVKYPAGRCLGPCKESQKEIVKAIRTAFIEPLDDQEKPKQVWGFYPSYRIKDIEVTG